MLILLSSNIIFNFLNINLFLFSNLFKLNLSKIFIYIKLLLLLFKSPSLTNTPCIYLFLFQQLYTNSIRYYY